MSFKSLYIAYPYLSDFVITSSTSSLVPQVRGYGTVHGSPGLAALLLVGPCATVVYNTAVARRSSEAMLSNIVNIVSVCTAFAIYAYRSRTCIALSHEVINLLTVYVCSYVHTRVRNQVRMISRPGAPPHYAAPGGAILMTSYSPTRVSDDIKYTDQLFVYALTILKTNTYPHTGRE